VKNVQLFYTILSEKIKNLGRVAMVIKISLKTGIEHRFSLCEVKPTARL
jgi:hypothetical protein